MYSRTVEASCSSLYQPAGLRWPRANLTLAQSKVAQVVLKKYDFHFHLRNKKNTLW